MICADVLGPWWDVEVTETDAETGETVTRRDQRRLPQFLRDVGEMPWQDVTGQPSEEIVPEPGVCVWRVWATREQIAAMESSESYVVLTETEVSGAFS